MTLWVGLTALEAEDYTYLTIQNADGSTSTVSLSALTLNISNGQLVATNAETSQSYTLSSLDRMYFAASPDVTIPSIGWATLYSECTLDITELGSALKAYTAEFGATSVTLTQVTQIPAKTAIVLCGTTNSLTLPVTATLTAAVNGNDLQGSTSDVTVNEDGYYALRASNDGTKVGFATVSRQVTIPAYKAYYVSNASNAPTFFVITNTTDDTTTSISNVNSETTPTDFYNLRGQRVTTPSKGLYIVNGKKVIIK